MKNIKRLLLSVCLLTSIFSFQANAMSTPAPIALNTGTPGQMATSTVLMDRLTEIQSLDKSKMSFREKKALRKEVRSIKKMVTAPVTNGVYISVGALIIIILLLILIL